MDFAFEFASHISVGFDLLDGSLKYWEGDLQERVERGKFRIAIEEDLREITSPGRETT